MKSNALARIRSLLSVTDKQNSVILALSYFTIFGFYCFTYLEYVYPVRYSAGYTYEISLEKTVFSIIVLFFIALFFNFRTGFRDFFLNVFVIIYLVPALVLLSLGGFDFIYFLWMLGAFGFLAIASRLRVPNWTKVGLIAEHHVSRLLLGLALILIVIASYLNGFRFVLNIYDVYQHRSAVNDQVTPIYAYITSITSKVILPFSAVMSLSFKRYAETFIAIILSFILYSVTGHKGILFYTVISVALYVYIRKFPAAYCLNMIFALLLGGAALDALAYSELGSGWAWGTFVDLIVRRGLFTPPLLDYLYIDYFTQHAWYWWSNSRVTLGFIPSPYPVTAPFLIGIEYFNKPTLSANSGFIGSGFSQAGWLGMSIYAVVLGGVISIANAMQCKFSKPVLISLLFVPIVTAMTGSDLLTTFLTHGMLLSFAILAGSIGRKGKV